MKPRTAFTAVFICILVLATPAAAQPSPPRDLEAVAGDANVELEWSQSLEDNVVNYRVYRGTNPSRKTEIASTGGETEFRDTDVENGVTYHYHVTALGREGESPPSNQVNATPTNPRNPPSPPTRFRLTSQPGPGEAHLNWRQPRRDGGAPVQEYRVYRGTSPRSDQRLTTVSVSSYTDTEVRRDEVYYYRVTAVNRFGESESTEKKIFTLSLEPTPPWAPDNLQAARSGDRVTLKWEEPRSGGADITRYRIYRSTADSGMELLDNTSRTEYTDTLLEGGTNYIYRVSAVNRIGEGILSTEVTVRMPADTSPPSPPTALQITETEDGAVLSWTIPGDTGGAPVTEYRVYRETGDEEEHLETVTDTNYTDSSVEPETTYNYSVGAVNSAGEGARSIQVTYTAGAGVGDGSGDTAESDSNQLPGFTATVAFAAVLVTVLARAWLMD